MLVNFQWSKLMEKRSRLNDPDPLLEKRIAAEDRPYRLVWSGTYDLPFGRGKAVMKGANRVVDYVVGGWNVNLITTFTTGTALGWGNVIYIGGPLNLDPHNVDNSFDTSQFNRVSAQQLGSNLRTFPTRFANLRADTVQQVDFSIIKGLPHHREGEDDLSLRVLQQHQPRHLQRAGSWAHVVHVRQDYVPGEYATAHSDGLAPGLLAGYGDWPTQVGSGSPGRTRTCDLAVGKKVGYRLMASPVVLSHRRS